MRKKVIFSIILAVPIFFSACGAVTSKSIYYEEVKESKDYILPIRDNKTVEDELQNNIFSFEHKYGKKYQAEELKIEGVDSPGGILCREQDILITDSENDILVEADYDGNVLQTIGKTGNGPLEFLRPGDITAYNDKIYIIDQKNYRVQVLDADLNYLDEIETRIVDQNDPDFVFEHIAVNEDSIYLNGFSFFHDHVYLYQSEGDPVIIGKNFVGPLFNYDNKIYAANTATKVYNKEKDTIGYRNGLDNYLFQVDDKKKDLELEYDLMPTLDPTSFVIDQENIIVLSPSHSSLFAFDKDGNYRYTLALIKEMQGERFSKLSVDGVGRYYVTAPDKGSIFRCSH